MNNISKLFLVSLLFSGCIFTSEKIQERIIKISIPAQLKAASYWPNKEDIIGFYGVPSRSEVSSYGEVLVFDNIFGCETLHVFFESDFEKGTEKLVSALVFKGIDQQSTSINLGETLKDGKLVSLSPLGGKGDLFRDRYSGLGSSARWVSNTTSTSLTIRWD